MSRGPPANALVPSVALQSAVVSGLVVLVTGTFSRSATASRSWCGITSTGGLTTGAGAWLLVEAVTDDAPSYPWILAVYALGVMVGFVVPLLPGGLGLREGVMVSLLAPRYGVGAATTLVLALRLVATFGELAAIGIGELIGLATRGPGRTPA